MLFSYENIYGTIAFMRKWTVWKETVVRKRRENLMEYVSQMYATFCALVPPLVAIVLALITKEVYSSLFIGIVIGGFFYGDIFCDTFNFERSITHIFQDGFKWEIHQFG